MKYFVLIFLFFSSSTVNAGIFFKIAIDNSSYSSFVVKSLENTKIQTHIMIKKMKDNYLNLDNVDKNFYQINIKRGVSLFEENLIVYELIPAFNDRFKHVIWTTKNETIVRKEVYDLHGKLMYSYGYVDEMPELKNEHKSSNKSNRKNCSKVSYYKGFELTGCKMLDGNTKHLVYSDGLNKFSVFIDRKAKAREVNGKIVLGNYVYRKKIGQNIYTMVGSVPLKIMKKVIKFIDKKEETNEKNN